MDPQKHILGSKNTSSGSVLLKKASNGGEKKKKRLNRQPEVRMQMVLKVV